MQFVKERLGSWIQAAIILVVGILCIVAGAFLSGSTIEILSSANDTLDAISLVLGIVMIVVGSLSLILACVTALLAKKGFAAVAIPGAAVLAIGISLVVAKYAATLIGLLLIVIPYLMICIGAVVLIDAIFNLVMALKAKAVAKALPGFVVGLIVAAAAIVLGALCVGDDPVIKFNVQLIVFGIVVCLAAVFQFLTTLVKLPDVIVIAKQDK